MMPGSTTTIGLRPAPGARMACSQRSCGQRLYSKTSACSRPRVRASSSAIDSKPLSSPRSATNTLLRVNESALK